MALSVTTTGNGALGNIEPGWTEQEFATPVSAVERAGGTGAVSFGAQDGGEGVLIIENGITSTDDVQGNVEGVVRNVSWSGNRISVTHDNKLARYNTTRNMPPMASASLPACLDLAEQMLGEVLFTRDSGAYWSLFGHGAAFDPDGERVMASNILTGGVGVLDLPGVITILPNSGIYNRIAASDFTAVNDVMYAGSILGSTLTPSQSGSLTNLTRMSCKVALNGGDWQMDISGEPVNTNAGYGFDVSILIDYSADTISFSGTATVGGIPGTPISGSTSLAALDLDAELALFMDWGDGTGRAQMNFRICNVTDYATYVNFYVDTETFTPLCGPFAITGNTRAFWIDEDFDLARLTRTNLCANPSFETNTTGWVALSGASIARSTLQSFVGAASLQVITPGSVANEGAFYSPIAVGSLTAGSTFYVGAWIKADIGVTVNVIAASTGAGFVNPNVLHAGTGNWEWVEVGPATLGANLNPYILARLPTPTATTYYIDGVLIEVTDTPGDYFDGSSTDSEGGIYAWLGPTNNSQSTKEYTVYQTPSEWQIAADYTVDGSVLAGQPSIGFNGPVWDWLQDACTVYRWEVGLDGDVVTTRPIGARTLDISNYEGVPTVNPSTTRTGRSIDVTYQGATVVAGEVVYEAREDDNRILSVGADQTVTTSVETNAYLTDIIQPSRTTTFIPGDGTYYIVDSTGLPIVADQWEDYGGGVSASIDPERPGTINVTIIGPTEIPSTSPPYSLSVSDGENQYAALSIIGSGVIADPKVQNILTGADPTKTPEDVGASVNGNAFINTREQAFDTGLWVTVDVSGPKITLDITVPSRALDGFGLTAGSVVYWRDNAYRVDSATVRNLSTSITATRFVTVGDFDLAWAGNTVGDHDLVWAPYETIDQKILSFKSTDYTG